MPEWLIAALPLLVIVGLIGFVFYMVCAVAFPKDKGGPRGGGMVE